RSARAKPRTMRAAQLARTPTSCAGSTNSRRRWGWKVDDDPQAKAPCSDRLWPRRARARGGARAVRAEGLHRVLQLPDRCRGEARRAGQPHPPRRSREAGHAAARRQSVRALRGDRRQPHDPGDLHRHPAGSLSRRAGRRDRRRARSIRRVQGRQRARQARRELHAEGSGRGAQEAGPLEDRERLRPRGREQGGAKEVIPELGHYALVLALALALIQASVPLWGARTNDATLMGVAAPAALAQFCFTAASFAALTWCYVASDFSVFNVFQNSHSTMPLVYKFTSVWGNHEGSMLLWVLILSVF